MKEMKQEDCRALENREEIPRKRPEWPDWEEARGREESAWR